MTKVLLSLHVLAAILTVGPVAVAASLFPRSARRASTSGDPDPGERVTGVAGARLLHRITRVYAVVGVAVPVFGAATASALGVLTDAWLLVSIALTAIAAGLLALVVLPEQARVLRELDPGLPPPAPGGLSRLAAATGVFNLLWATVTVLMIVRPGSTTGA